MLSASPEKDRSNSKSIIEKKNSSSIKINSNKLENIVIALSIRSEIYYKIIIKLNNFRL